MADTAAAITLPAPMEGRRNTLKSRVVETAPKTGASAEISPIKKAARLPPDVPKAANIKHTANTAVEIIPTIRLKLYRVFW